jgi:hypothetical protein
MLRRAAPFVFGLLCGCYRYSPVTEPAVAPGSHVRFALDESGGPALRSVLGDQTVAVEGQVLGASDSVYTVAVQATLKRGTVSPASRIVWAGESVMIPRAAVRQTEVRSLDRGRTTRAIAVGAVAAFITVRLIVAGVGNSSGGDNGGPIITPP